MNAPAPNTPAIPLPLTYEEAQARDRLAIRAHALDVHFSGGPTYASTLDWWRSIIEQTHRDLKPVNFTALLALPNAALFGRLIAMRAAWTRHLIAKVNAAGAASENAEQPKGQANG